MGTPADRALATDTWRHTSNNLMLVFQFASGSSRDDACLLDGSFFLVHVVGGTKNVGNKGKSFSFVSFSSSSMDRDDGRMMPWSLPLEVAVVRVPLVATRGDFRSPLVPLKKISLEEKRNFKLIKNKKKVRSPYFQKKKI